MTHFSEGYLQETPKCAASIFANCASSAAPLQRYVERVSTCKLLPSSQAERRPCLFSIGRTNWLGKLATGVSFIVLSFVSEGCEAPVQRVSFFPASIKPRARFQRALCVKQVLASRLTLNCDCRSSKRNLLGVARTQARHPPCVLFISRRSLQQQKKKARNQAARETRRGERRSGMKLFVCAV